jgi:hypothetical protein
MPGRLRSTLGQGETALDRKVLERMLGGRQLNAILIVRTRLQLVLRQNG